MGPSELEILELGENAAWMLVVEQDWVRYHDDPSECWASAYIQHMLNVLADD